MGSPTSSQLSREQKHISCTRLSENNDVICLQEVHGKDEFFQANQILVPQFGKNNRKKEETPCHVITCQGRDHTVSIHSGDSILVIVDVHFEPDLTL